MQHCIEDFVCAETTINVVALRVPTMVKCVLSMEELQLLSMHALEGCFKRRLMFLDVRVPLWFCTVRN